jgi:glucose-6-phosphate isomerase
MPSLWNRYHQYLVRHEGTGFSVDVSRVRFDEGFLARMEPLAQKAFSEMKELEAGAIANRDENRMVGHYWLRAPQLAPTPELSAEISGTNASIKQFVSEVHAAGKFTDILLIGIGGSALGPQFLSDALGTNKDPMRLHFFDNTDPDGFDRILEKLEPKLAQTLTVVVSKSGGTKETRNGMIEAGSRYRRAGLDFGQHAVAVTGVGSELDKVATKENWLRRFPMWDWVGGRTSVMSAVGVVPLSLQGLDMEQVLVGAAAMDEWTRVGETLKNPAMLLALSWHFEGGGAGKKDMVVLPYKDRLLLFSRYLQQLVMESLGKELDRDGKVAHQGIAVYGNKGSTDQHAYVQQLRDGVNNFFVTFVEVREDRKGAAFETEPGVTSGDYLQGFLRGSRTALYDSGRDSITVSLPSVTAFSVGALIALYDRAVGFYGTLVNTNAYHQPGVEAGKKAATAVLSLQSKVLKLLGESAGSPKTAAEAAAQIGDADPEAVYHILEHLAANHANIAKKTSADPSGDTFVMS